MFVKLKYALLASTFAFAMNVNADSCNPSVTVKASSGPDAVNFPGNFVVHDFYGGSVDRNGDYYFVAAPGAHSASQVPQKSASGAIYVYHKNNGTWGLSQIITSGGNADHFGAASVKSDGEWLIISAFGTPIGGDTPLLEQDFRGSVRIYKLNSGSGQWDIYQVLDSSTVPELADLSVRVFTNPSDPTQSNPSGALFGSSLSVDFKKGWMVVGAQGQNSGEGSAVVKEAGAAYFFKWNDNTNQWKFKQKVTNPNGAFERDNFGSAVELNDRWAMVSNGDLQNHPEGRALNSNVWVYRLQGGDWNYIQQLSGQSQSVSDSVGFFSAFGNSLSIDENWAIVGSPLDSTNGRAMGAAYVFKADDDDWSLKQIIYSDEAFNPDAPGHMLTYLNGVKIKNDLALIGDPGHSGPNGEIHQGSIFVYKRQGQTWNQELNIFDPNGQNHDFFGSGTALRGKMVLGGTITAVDLGYPNFMPPVGRTFVEVAPGVFLPVVSQGKAVLFKTHCLK